VAATSTKERAKPARKAAAAKAPAAQETTRDKILDAAEFLFGERTFDTVSLRDITEHAQVTLALASYHFRTKDKLLAEVVARRASILGDARRKRLATLEKSGKLTTEAILDAFMRPMAETMRGRDQGWASYVRILAQLGQSNRWLHLLHENFDPTAELFLDRLQATLPKVSRPLLMRGFSLALVAMLQTLSKNRRVDSLSDGAVTADDIDEAYVVLLKFSTRGLEALSELH
jgi:AcrR family transcriptional regulator